MSSIVPRSYQEKSILALRLKIREGKKRIVLMSPTGSGKGLIMAMLAKAGLDKKSRALTVLYGQELILQTEENYKRYYNIKSQVIMGGIKSDPADSMIASISTLSRRNFPEGINFIIVDECHMTNSPTYQKLFDAYPDAIFIGLSATPFNNLVSFEDSIIVASVQELIDLGYLVKPRHFRPKKFINTDNVSIIAGDYAEDELASEAMKITGDVIAEYERLAKGRIFVCFCVNVKHSKEVCEAFNQAGYNVKHIDGSMHIDERQEILRQLRAGEIDGVTNVNVLSTGVDVPEIACVIMARPTKSLILYIQQAGRGLRLALNKLDCILIDLANNISRFGFVTDEREPVLAPKEKKKKKEKEAAISVWICEACFGCNPDSALFCVDCNEPRQIKIKDIKTVEGELEEVTALTVKKVKTKKVVTVMPFGQYRGTPIHSLPDSALHWALNRTNDGSKESLQDALKAELQRRMQAND